MTDGKTGRKDMSEEKDDIWKASCACLDVVFIPIHNKDGSYTERWACKDCGNEFVKKRRLSQAEAELQIDCRDCREGDGSCDKMHMPSGTMKLFLLNLQEDNEKLKARLSHLMDVAKKLANWINSEVNYRDGQYCNSKLGNALLAEWDGIKKKEGGNHE